MANNARLRSASRSTPVFVLYRRPQLHIASRAAPLSINFSSAHRLLSSYTPTSIHLSLPDRAVR